MPNTYTIILIFIVIIIVEGIIFSLANKLKKNKMTRQKQLNWIDFPKHCHMKKICFLLKWSTLFITF